MAKYSVSNAKHQALFGLNDEQLRRKNLSDADIAQLRSVQRGDPQPDDEPAPEAAPSERSAPRQTARQAQSE